MRVYDIALFLFIFSVVTWGLQSAFFPGKAWSPMGAGEPGETSKGEVAESAFGSEEAQVGETTGGVQFLTQIKRLGQGIFNLLTVIFNLGGIIDSIFRGQLPLGLTIAISAITDVLYSVAIIQFVTGRSLRQME